MFVVLALCGALVWFYEKYHHLSNTLKDLKTKAPDFARESSQKLMDEASAKAGTIISTAEMDALKIATEKSIESGLMAEQTAKLINANFKQLADTLTARLDESAKTYNTFVGDAENKIATSQAQIEAGMRTKVNELLFNFEQNLSGFLSSSEQNTLEALNLELRSARQLIESYKTQQLALVDENIVSVLERTLDLVLKEKLSLRNQLDLVYESLEKAKTEKFFV